MEIPFGIIISPSPASSKGATLIFFLMTYMIALTGMMKINPHGMFPDTVFHALFSKVHHSPPRIWCNFDRFCLGIMSSVQIGGLSLWGRYQDFSPSKIMAEAPQSAEISNLHTTITGQWAMGINGN